METTQVNAHKIAWLESDYKATFRAAAAKHGIDPERGATSYQVVLVKAAQAEAARKPMDWLRYASLDGEDANRLYGDNPIETMAFQRVNAEARRHVKPIEVKPALSWDTINGRDLKELWREVVLELKPEAERKPEIRAAADAVRCELRNEARERQQVNLAVDVMDDHQFKPQPRDHFDDVLRVPG